jgi:hypothetical protein
MLRRPQYNKCTKETSPGGEALTLRQKLALVVGTTLKAETIIDMNDDAINHAFLRENGIGATVLRAANIPVAQLRQRGVDTMAKMVELGFSTLHLIDEPFCTELVASFGADAVLTELFCSASDAVIIAGSPAVAQLGLDVGMLLLLCAQKPLAAREVLAQCRPRGACLHGVPPLTLIETGITALHLTKLGFDAEAVRKQTLSNSEQMSLLGF